MKLAPRELWVLQMLAEGRTARQAAHIGKIELHTVNCYRKGMFAKLGAHTSAQAVAIAFRQGLLK